MKNQALFIKKIRLKTLLLLLFSSVFIVFSQTNNPILTSATPDAAFILGNPDYKAISYGGYRSNSRDVQPTVEEIVQDLKILAALGYRLIRTYNVHFPFAENILKAIDNLKNQDPDFEMYMMLGVWINCKGAWTARPNHEEEDIESNTEEIKKAIALVQKYPEIVKVISVGNEARVHWAQSYFVPTRVILKWVNFLQDLKMSNQIPPSLWITSSDDYASWGGGDVSYHEPELQKLVEAVDFISIHTYPFHNTHYNPDFWNLKKESVTKYNKKQLIDRAMYRARDFAINQYLKVKNYVNGLGLNKPIHIGETGWATNSSDLYGNTGTAAADEYKQALYYKLMNDWSKKNNTTVVFFEAFDEVWKNAEDPLHSENHFGLFTLKGNAKFALWDAIDNQKLKNLTREKNTIQKTFGGDDALLWTNTLIPPKQ